jgi:arylsulfatase A-like enzyme
MIGIFVLGISNPWNFSRAAEPQRPNVLFLFGDDHRADTIGAYGNTVCKTPNIDRLAARGTLFRRAYMQGGFNGATCVPSRAMLLSGRSLFTVDESLKTETIWPAAFGDAGYATFLSGKWHNAPGVIGRSFGAARAVFLGGMTNPMKAPLHELKDGQMVPSGVSDRHACEIFADETIKFLAAQKPGASFFAYLPFDAPHDPHVVPDDFPVKYAAKDVPLPPDFLPEHPFDNGDMHLRDEKLLKKPLQEDAVRAFNAEYWRYVTYLDAQVGRVLDALDKSPFASNTIVVYAGDSGVARGSHGLIGKQNLYEHSMRVPLIVAGPGIPAGRQTDAACYLFDVLPTLGKRCGVKAPPASEGIDLNPVLNGETDRARGELTFAYRSVQRAVSLDGWKLIDYPKIGRVQLFNLMDDPHEINDLSGKPELTERIAALRAKLPAVGGRSAAAP